MLVLDTTQLNAIIEHALRGYPDETCGILAGSISGSVRTVEHVFAMANADRSSTHFSFNVREQFDVARTMRERGWVALANYHSHPTAPAIPSAEDIRLTYDEHPWCAIVSLLDPHHPQVRVWHIHDAHATELPLSIVK